MLTITGAVSFVRYAQRHRANPWLAAVAPFDIYVPGLEAWRVRLAEELTAQLDSMKPLDAVSQDVVRERWRDRKSTRLNSSHSQISYAVFCLKKKQDA